MSLGKRPRPPMRRTTSMTEFTVDELSILDPNTTPGHQPNGKDHPSMNPMADPRNYLSMASPRYPRRNSTDFLETAPFLQSCGLCKRRLAPGRDIYMYKGETAFCSLECRQQQMNQDERKERCSLASIKKEVPAQNTASETTNKGERVAAA